MFLVNKKGLIFSLKIVIILVYKVMFLVKIVLFGYIIPVIFYPSTHPAIQWNKIIF